MMDHSTQNSSWGWKGILWGLNIIIKQLAWKAGAPTFLRTWEDKWVDGEIPQRKESNSGPPGFEEQGNYVSDLVLPGGLWNVSLVGDLFEDRWRDKILAIPLPRGPTRDDFYWHGTTNGEYSVKMGYHYARDHMFDLRATNKDRSRRDAFLQYTNSLKIWHLPGPSKWRTLVWKIMTDTLPLGSEFYRRNMNIDPHCQVCRDDLSIETLISEFYVVNKTTTKQYL